MNKDIKENEMHCPECGKLINIDSINCKFCGENIDDVIKHSKIKKEIINTTGDAKDEDSDVQELTAKALWEIRDIKDIKMRILTLLGYPWETGVEGLIKALQDKSWGVRSNAAEALGKIEDARAVEPLTEALKDKSWIVRSSAAGALEKIKDATKAVEPLKKLESKEVMELLIRALTGPEIEIRGLAAIALGVLNADFQAFETRGLMDSVLFEYNYPQSSSSVLTKYIPLGAFQPIRDNLSKDKDISPRVVEALRQALDDDSYILHSAPNPLYGNGLYISPSLFMGWDSKKGEIRGSTGYQYHVQIAAALSLVLIGDKKSTGRIVQMISRQFFGGRAPMEVFLRLMFILGWESVPGELLKIFEHDKKPYLIEWACNCLFAIEAQHFLVEPMINRLSSVVEFERMNAVKILGQIGDTRALEPLIEALKDKDWNVQEKTAEALGKIGDERAVEPLIYTLKDKSLIVRRASTVALVKIGEPAVGPLIKALDDENWYVRYYAAEVLGKIGDKRAVEPLKKALKDEIRNVRSKAAEALEKIKTKKN